MAAPGSSSHALRAMMAMAAATASAAAGDASAVVLAPPSAPRSRTSSRPTANRRQSINQLHAHLESAPLPKGAPLPSAADGVRSARIAAVAAEIASKWLHPPDSSQYETDVLHQVRAILYMNKSLITQSFVSHVSGVSQGSLSHYVRGLFRGNQQNIEDRLGNFIRKFAAGDLDTFLEEARSGSRPLRAVICDTTFATPAASPPSNPLATTPNTIIIPTAAADPRPPPAPPVPPPPPPQLLPAPWTRPPPPPQPLRLPPQPDLPPRPDAPMMRLHEFSQYDVTDRAARARHRHVSQRKRERTPFVKRLEDSAEPSPVDAVERAYHALVAPNWTIDPTHAEPLLLPVELFGEAAGHTLHMFTQWDVNDRTLSPELVADRIRRARRLPHDFVKPIAMQIRRALFSAGIVCAAPPAPPGANEENRRLIRIDVELAGGPGSQNLRDEFEWDLGIGSMNSPELFAHCLCSDAGIPQKHAATVARAIREKLVLAHAIAYGDEETKRMALSVLPEDDPLRNPLPKVFSVFSRDVDHSAASREANEAEINDMYIAPLVDAVVAESERRSTECKRNTEDETKRKDFEEIRAVEEAHEAERRAKIEESLLQVEQAAIELQKERGLDFRPYLALKIARGERLGTWTPAVFDRKRRRQTSFPMTAVSRLHTAVIPAVPRAARRRRSTHRRDRRSEGRSQLSKSATTPVKRSAEAMESEVKGELKRVVVNVKDLAVRVRLRVRPARITPNRNGSNPKKRRRR